MPPPSDLAPAPFIVGVPRSGTTLLRLQLDAHPELALPAETGFGEVARRFEGSAVTRDELLDALTSMPTWADLAMSRDELAGLLAEVEDWDLSSGLRAFYRGYAAARGKTRYGDKTPMHATDIDVLRACFLRRASSTSSVTGVTWPRRSAAFRSRRATEELSRSPLCGETRSGARAVPPQTFRSYTEVRYEALVTEPERVLRELCDFLELEFAPEMLLRSRACPRAACRDEFRHGRTGRRRPPA